MAHAPQDRRVKEAYDNLIRQTTDQYHALVDAGYRFWFLDMREQASQDYASTPWNAMRDLRANQELGVFPTNEGFGSNDKFDVTTNLLFAETEFEWAVGSPDSSRRQRVLANDLFRAVHDAFGHGMEGAGFRARGEENAWQAHARLFTGSALGALTSETRGQNSWLNYGPHGESNQTASVEDTVFADQKSGLMPEWTWTEGRVGDAKLSRTPIEFSGKEFGGPQPIKQLVLKAREYARKHFAGKTVTNESDGADIEIPWSGIKHAFSGPVSEVAAVAAWKLDEVVESADYIGEEPDNRNRNTVAAVRRYRRAVSIGGAAYTLDVLVRETTSGRFYYDHFEVRNDETPAPGEPSEVSLQGVSGGSQSQSDNPDVTKAKFSRQPKTEKSPQTKTAAFKKWFGDSKVVDENGEPLVVYHGTEEDFSKFDKRRVRSNFPYSLGFHFTDRPAEANVYAGASDAEPAANSRRPLGGNVMPVHLKATNPLEIETDHPAASMEADLNRASIIEKLVAAKREGRPYDAVIIRRKKGNEYDGVNVIVFDPNQIKSATGNVGTFDPKNPDIRYSRQPIGTRQSARNVLERSDVLDMLKLSDGPVRLAEGKVLKGQRNHPLMRPEVWKQIPDWLDNPAAVFDSDTEDGLVFIAPETVEGRPIRMIVKSRKGGGADVQILANAYDAAPETPYGRWFRDGLAHYVDTKEFPAVLQRSGRQLPSSAWQNKPGSLRKILTQKNLAGYRKSRNAETPESGEPSQVSAQGFSGGSRSQSDNRGGTKAKLSRQAVSEKPFYSQMQRALEAKLPNRGSAKTLSSMIVSLQKNGQFKVEEAKIG